MAMPVELRPEEPYREGEAELRARLARWPQLVNFFAYWRAKRGSRPFPQRRDIDPIELRQVLPNILLAELVPPEGRIRFRIVGSKLAEHYGQDFSGQFLDELDYGAALAAVRREYEETIRTGQPQFSEMEYWNYAGRHFRIRRLLLPLSEDQKFVNMIIGVCLLERWRPK